MTLEPLLGSTALYRADVSWNTSLELSVPLSQAVMRFVALNIIAKLYSKGEALPRQR